MGKSLVKKVAGAFQPNNAPASLLSFSFLAKHRYKRNPKSASNTKKNCSFYRSSLQNTDISTMCFGKKSSISADSFSSSSSDEFNARPIELNTIRRVNSPRCAARGTAYLPYQVAQAASDRDTIRVVNKSPADHANQQKYQPQADPSCLPFHVFEHDFYQTQTATLTYPTRLTIIISITPVLQQSTTMCLPVFKHSCFVFGAVINLVLLSLTIYTAQTGKPFAVWGSLLIAFLLAFVFVASITMGNLRYEPRHTPNSSYIVPLYDEEIELYHIGTSPLSTIEEDPAQTEVYRRLLRDRPLPPEPALSPPRRGSPFPTLISPMSDPF
ncbi:unnamed protein product, partial [Aureobasidium uvarum]